MKKLIISILILSSATAIFAQQNDTASYNLQLIVGTYTNARSEGIYTYNFNSRTGQFAKISSIYTPNPSYLTTSPDRKFVYAVNELSGETGRGAVTAFANNNGVLTKINEQPSGGDDPCYISVDATNKWIVVGNYTGSNFSIFPINTDGSIGVATSTTNHIGSSMDKERQEKPHVHCTVFSPDNKYLLVADLGTDEISSYKFNEKTGALGKVDYTEIQAGGGPRHIAFHPNGKYAYLVEEMYGNVDIFKYKKGKLKKQQTISMIPPKTIGKIGAADIHLSADGRFLYTSNRGDVNKITIFSVDEKGNLKVAGYQPAMGITPRNFTIDPSGNFLLVANQNSDEVVIFKRDKRTGLLTDTNTRIKIPNPVCLKWNN